MHLHAHHLPTKRYTSIYMYLYSCDQMLYILDTVCLYNKCHLFFLQYGDDYDAASDRPISVLKQHTMFNDTHL